MQKARRGRGQSGRRVSIYLGARVHSSPKRLETAAARKKILSARRNSVDQSSLAIIISRGNAHTRDGNKLCAHTMPFSSFFFLPKRIIPQLKHSQAAAFAFLVRMYLNFIIRVCRIPWTANLFYKFICAVCWVLDWYIVYRRNLNL